MVLLKDKSTMASVNVNQDLHSNMVLLKAINNPIAITTIAIFTFQYGSIKGF